MLLQAECTTVRNLLTYHRLRYLHTSLLACGQREVQIHPIDGLLIPPRVSPSISEKGIKYFVVVLQFLFLNVSVSVSSRMLRSRRTSTSSTSRGGVQPSPWCTCSESCTSGMRATAGVCVLPNERVCSGGCYLRARRQMMSVHQRARTETR